MSHVNTAQMIHPVYTELYFSNNSPCLQETVLLQYSILSYISSFIELQHQCLREGRGGGVVKKFKGKKNFASGSETGFLGPLGFRLVWGD